MKIDWGHKTEKSFGNGVFRVTIKEAIVAVMSIGALIGGFYVWKYNETIKAVKASAADSSIVSKLNSIEKDTDAIKGKADAIDARMRNVEDRVMVLETVARMTSRNVHFLRNEPVFDPDVTQIKVKRPTR